MKSASQMSTTGQATDRAIPANDETVDGLPLDPMLAFEFSLSEADALRTWLLRSTVDGSTALDDVFVNRALSSLGKAVDAARATVNVRHELEQAGLSAEHLTDEQVRELGRRVSDAALPAVRA